MLIVETDSDPGTWFHVPLYGTRAEFAEWMDLQLDAIGLLRGRRPKWREKRELRKFLEGKAAMLRDRLGADQAFLFGPMPSRAAPLVLFVKQFACDEEHSVRHLRVLAEPDPDLVDAGRRTETTPFVSPRFGEGLRCLTSWTASNGILMLSVTYAWHDPAHGIELVLKGYYDDPALLEASFDAIDDFARSLSLRDPEA
ncbi:hypothetical protein ACFWNK_20535 [Streptomyces sp. NPDC058417]|uniref:hypothetical protein n=1 Tax=unclassified Streptomyces TaxID=2593676 RepID=UPI003668C62E